MSEVLDNPVLVLNKHWHPISTTTVFDALNKVYQDKAFIVGEDYGMYSFDQWVANWEEAIRLAHVADDKVVIPCVRFELVAPEVIVVKNYGGFRVRQVRFSRRNIFLRDDYRCQYCGKNFPSRDLNIDHVVPRSRGGKTTWTNVVLSCVPCNSKKANRTPKEAGMRLIRTPKKPNFKQLQGKVKGKVRGALHQTYPKSWEDFLGKMYWDASLDGGGEG